MLTNPQKAILKRAQREAGLSDGDYRDALELITGCRTSTSPALTDRHLDKLLAYLEAIHWRAVDAGTLQPSGSGNAVFRQRGFWAGRNTNAETSRDRFNETRAGQAITELEGKLAALGYGQGYCVAIRNKVAQGRDDAHGLNLYRVALERTVKSKARRAARAEDPY